MFAFVFLLSCVVNVTGGSEVIGSHEPVKVTVGQDAILPCYLEPPMDVTTLTVEWEHNGKHVHVYRSRDDDLDNQDEYFKDRTSLFRDEMIKGNISLKLTKVTELDAGRYTCFVPKLYRLVNVILIVGGSEVIGSHEPVKVTVGQDAILPCYLEPPMDATTLTVEWARNGKEVHLYRSRTDDLVRQDENFKDRTSLFHDEMIKGNISLKLTKVTELDAGIYTCFVPKLQVRRSYVILIVEYS